MSWVNRSEVACILEYGLELALHDEASSRNTVENVTIRSAVEYFVLVCASY